MQVACIKGCETKNSILFIVTHAWQAVRLTSLEEATPTYYNNFIPFESKARKQNVLYRKQEALKKLFESQQHASITRPASVELIDGGQMASICRCFGNQQNETQGSALTCLCFGTNGVRKTAHKISHLHKNKMKKK